MATTTVMNTKRVHFESPGSQSAPHTLLLGYTSSSTSKRLSASCQQVVSETFQSNNAEVAVRSCLADSQLYPIVATHKCNKTPLCPSALWADMALVVAEYIWKTLRPGTEVPGLNNAHMDVPKPLLTQVPQKGQGQHVEMIATAELGEGEAGVVKCSFTTVNPDDGTKIADHATCSIIYESKAAWSEEWSRYSHMVLNSIKILHDRALTGDAHRMQRGLAYKLFETFVSYPQTYRGMTEVIFSNLEGTASLDLQTTDQDYRGPYHLDNTCHLSGFICQAFDTESEDFVYISEGWKGARYMDLELLRTGMSKGRNLVNYVRMQHKPGKILQGDLYVLLDDEVVAVWEAIKFKQLPRRVLNVFLPRPRVDSK